MDEFGVQVIMVKVEWFAGEGGIACGLSVRILHTFFT